MSIQFTVTPDVARIRTTSQSEEQPFNVVRKINVCLEKQVGTFLFESANGMTTVILDTDALTQLMATTLLMMRDNTD